MPRATSRGRRRSARRRPPPASSAAGRPTRTLQKAEPALLVTLGRRSDRMALDRAREVGIAATLSTRSRRQRSSLSCSQAARRSGRRGTDRCCGGAVSSRPPRSPRRRSNVRGLLQAIIQDARRSVVPADGSRRGNRCWRECSPRAGFRQHAQGLVETSLAAASSPRRQWAESVELRPWGGADRYRRSERRGAGCAAWCDRGLAVRGCVGPGAPAQSRTVLDALDIDVPIEIGRGQPMLQLERLPAGDRHPGRPCAIFALSYAGRTILLRDAHAGPGGLDAPTCWRSAMRSVLKRIGLEADARRPGPERDRPAARGGRTTMPERSPPQRQPGRGLPRHALAAQRGATGERRGDRRDLEELPGRPRAGRRTLLVVGAADIGADPPESSQAGLREPPGCGGCRAATAFPWRRV